MRKSLLLILISLSVSLSSLLLSTNEIIGDTSGPNSGKCGAPSDNYTNCTSCHNGSTTTATGWITSNIPGSGYVAGTTYTITATATYAGLVRFGFQISPQNTSGVKLGTLVLTNTTATQLVGSSKYVEHKSAGTIGTTGYHTWTFNWIAPVAGSGPVNFYGCFNCANNNGSESGDHIYNSVMSVIEGGCSISAAITANGPTTFCAGGSVTLDAGSGFSTYHWSNNSSTQTINVTSAGTYSVTVTNSTGCSAVATSPAVVINSAPAVPVITPSGATSFCQGGSVSLSATSGASTYHWSNNASTQTINVSTAGNYIVTVTNNSGCQAVSLATSVVVNSLPSVPVITPNGTTTFCQGGSVTLSATSGASTYHWSDNETTQNINVTASGSYMVSVTNNNGCQAVSTATSVVVNPLPSATITGSSTICAGSSSTLNAGAGFSSYHWSTNATTQTISVSSANTYYVTVTNVTGCSASTSITVTVGSGLSPTITGSTTICSGTSTVLNAGSGYSTYHWSTNASTQTITVNTASIYSVTVTNASGCSGSTSITVTAATSPSPTITGVTAICSGASTSLNSGGGYSTYNWSTGATSQIISVSSAGVYTVTVTNASGCSGSSSKTITVNTNPSPTISGASAICSGTNTTLNAGSGFSSYLWSTNATTLSITVNSANTYSVTVTNSSGCTGTASKSVVVNTAPVPTITGVSTICGGSSTVLHAGAGFVTYQWSTGSTNQNITVTAANTYYVTVTNSGGCSGSDSKIVTVGSIPTPVISANGPTSICQGGNLILTADSGFANYNWSNGSTLSSVSVNVSGSYTVAVSDVSGCTGVSNAINISINDTPICSGWIQPSQICSGDAAYISIDGDTSWTYVWNPGMMSGMTLTVMPAVSTTYVVTATNSVNCSTTYPLPITVFPLPFTPAIIQSGGVLIAMANNASSYQWYLNGLPISGATDMTYNPIQQTGNYTVIISNQFGCEKQSSMFGYYGVGISALSNSMVTIYPNPFNDFISFQNLDEKNLIEIMNVQGQVLISMISSNENETINTTELASGIYLLKVKSANGVLNRVVVKN